ncbi:DoxX family membrane protein [Nocardioides zeae]|uniref:DoxX family membrane protein n=1 Tax=Nocardioides imazamoxiresistens TaxID=3231893 RepID=A0ABU3PY64_9ACTN|nr:DoxX family membrane protein [Nocardioides zeae]MDT9593715.1 DoxX family membrane protein [Nocardioides zeae]
MTVTRLIARPLLATMFAVGGVNALRNAEAIAPRAAKVTDKLVPKAQKAGAPVPSDALTLVRLNAAVHLVAAAGLATGKAPRASAAVLAATLVPTTLAGHPFWEETDPAAKGNQQVHFFKNVSLLGGLLLAAVDTDGKPGLAWRARRAAKDAQREARTLAKSAKREAKLAKAQLT